METGSAIHEGECLVKYVTAYIKPFKFSDLREALTAVGICGLTASEVSGYGRQKGQTEVYRGAEYTASLVPKIRLEIAASDDMAAKIVEVIARVAHTGEIGDGKIFVRELLDVVRIRTGERGELGL